MPLIEILEDEPTEEKDTSNTSFDSSSDVTKTEESHRIEEFNLSKESSLDISETHAASWDRRVPDYRYDAGETHPGACYALSRDIKLASELKEKGNSAYKRREYEEAIDMFSEAIARVPLETGEHNYSLAVFYGNRAAARLQLCQYEKTITDCDMSVKYDPTYVKAIMRRSKANEKLNKLEDALADMKRAAEVAPTCVRALRECRRLDAAVKTKHEEMKTEVLGKLKDLGNSILGNFGMSLDNFKAVQDPATGSYSISYQN